jgi:histidinol phosphatase-like PHP family hydrolase
MINLHNHSTWSDGQYTAEMLVKNAVVHGLTHVGISDHFFTMKLTLPQFYVGVDQIDAYAAELRQIADKYGRWIQVLAGIEVDWSARASPLFPALWPQLDLLDYVIFEYVQNEEWFGDSLEALIEVLPEISIPAGLAHNNLRQNFAECYTPEVLIALLQEHHLFVELSTNPETLYYRDRDPYNTRLWDALAESEVRFSIGSDAHRRIDDVARVADAHQFLGERGLLDRLITAAWDPDARRWDESLL